jgi:hypothetical protein
MTQKVFSSELKKFRTEHSAPLPGSTTVNYSPLAKTSSAFSIPLRSAEKSLFEQLLLFDTVQLSITGANVIAPLLCNRMGMKVFEELLEQDAIMFVQWEPEPMMTHDGKEVKATFVGRIDDGGPIDIEKRIDQGFLLEHVGSPTHRKGVKNKLLRQTSILQEQFGDEAWRLAGQALSSGSFEHLGLPSGSSGVLGLTVQQGETVRRAAESLTIYRHVLENNMMAAENEGVFDLFAKVVTDFEQPDLRLEQFGVLAEYAQFPNLRELFGVINNPFQHAAKFRQTSVATTFRAWLSTLGNKTAEFDIIRDYVDACKGRKGFFEPRTYLKTASKVAIGTALSAGAAKLGADAVLTGLAGLAGLSASTAGALQNKALKSASGLFGNFMISNFAAEWTPKAYFDGLRKIKEKATQE